jgi:hypothetical protein
MSFNASFSISSIGSNNTFTLTDTSTGSDTNLTDRTISLFNSAGTLINNTTIDWPIGESSITINSLSQDYGVNISVSWASSSPLPSPSTYTYSDLQSLTQYAEQFYYTLTQRQTAAPNTIQDQLYFENKSKLRTLIDSANQAITEGGDIYSCQGCITQYQLMINNSTLYF